MSITNLGATIAECNHHADYCARSTPGQIDPQRLRVMWYFPDMAAKNPSSRGGQPLDAEIDATMHAARVLVAVLARSVDAVESVVTMPQLRILMLVGDRGQMNLSAVAESLRVHPSNASRACDRLVGDKLLERRDSTTDRRNLILELSPQGRALVDSVLETRRQAMREILARMSPEDRQQLTTVFTAFADAAVGSVGHDDITPIWGS